MSSATVHHAHCRLVGHNWTFTTVTEQGSFYIQGLLCGRCKTVRKWRIHKRSGRPMGNQYKHPDDYSVQGGFSQRDKDQLRLNAAVGNLNRRSRRERTRDEITVSRGA